MSWSVTVSALSESGASRILVSLNGDAMTFVFAEGSTKVARLELGMGRDDTVGAVVSTMSGTRSLELEFSPACGPKAVE
jgi:hypothetical protein